MKRKWRIIIGVVIIAVFLGFAFYNGSKGLEADLLEVNPGTIAKTFEEDGEVVSEVQRTIYALYGGRIESLLVSEGQAVKEGDLLAQIDDTDLRLQLESLKSQHAAESLNELSVEQAKQQLEAATRNYDRINQLYKEGAVTEKELEEARDRLEAAQSNLKQRQNYLTGSKAALESQISLLQQQLKQCSIIAPVSGIVSNLAAKEGQVVSPASPLMTIFKEGFYEIEVYVLTDDIGYVKEGIEVELILEKDSGDIKFTGKVDSVAPSAVDAVSALGLEEKRVKVTVKPETTEKVKLRPGYEVKVVFTVNKLDNKLVVPKTALFPYENGEALWVVREGKAGVQPVKTGFENERDVVIEEGINVGDFIILNPQLEGLKERKKINFQNRYSK